ncbi:MAG TPA: DUF1684 domain-containing protein [Steroidobacteraceae bacterium]|nr:DUF1684 domain-containing protein [Steroidobacteraceae bacterium]
MSIQWRNLALAAVAVATTCLTMAAMPAGEDDTAIAAWRAQRLASLTDESGWLTLVGLYWLKDGANTFGRDRSNAISLNDPQLGRRAGRFVLSGGAVRFEAGRGGCVQLAGRPLIAQTLQSDLSGEPTVLSCGSLQFFVIERGGQFGVRIRDRASRARREFRGLDYFPADPNWAIAARFEPYDPPHHVPIVNVLGMQIDMESPGAIVFERDGHEWRLDSLLEEPGADELFVMFADATSGHETYGGGRFLSAPLPAAGKVLVDFNKAYNPPCAFTPFATCPLPPPQNHLTLRVSAGELRYGEGGH